MRLLTIPISHYCEKARWALDRAGVAYVEEPHVQGVHAAYALRAAGSRTVPVLVTADDVLHESEDIVAFADRRLPAERRLIPDDELERDVVLELSRELDAGLGPDGRRLVYARMVPHPALLIRFNNQGVPAWESALVRRAYGPFTGTISSLLGVGPSTVEDDTPKVQAAFDRIAERLADGRPYLCGERFTAADLTFACLAAPMVAPPGYGVPLPQPWDLPDELAAEFAAWRAHPAGAFALRMYREERGRLGG